jgi:hypothetical protein
VVLHLFLIAIFGILIPYAKGMDFFDPVVTGAYACMGALFAGPAAAQSFGANRPQSMREAYRRAGKAILFGEALVFLCLLLGTLTVSFDHGRFLLPELDVLAETGLLGLAGTTAVAILAGWSALYFSPITTRLIMRLLFLALLLAFYYNSRRLTDVAVPGIVLCSVAIAAGLVLLKKEVCPQ